MLRRLNSLEEVDVLIAEGAKLGNEAKRVDFLANAYYDPGIRTELDPFGEEYLAEMLKLHASISGFAEYAPAKHELMAPYLREQVAELTRKPAPFGDGIQIIGDYIMALGFIMKTINLAPGKRYLEYGPGGGQLAIFLARAGYDVTVVDIEPAYIEAIEGQCRAIGIPITAMVGEFGDTPDPAKQYDAVVFFEAFHHCLRHNAVLRRLQDVVSEDGLIAVSGEPIHPAGSYWEPTVPLAWGPRCDVLSLCAMRGLGWMELGFRETYFYEALGRAGWRAEKHECLATARGNTYVIRRGAYQPAASKPAVPLPAVEPVIRTTGERRSDWAGAVRRWLRGKL